MFGASEYRSCSAEDNRISGAVCWPWTKTTFKVDVGIGLGDGFRTPSSIHSASTPALWWRDERRKELSCHGAEVGQ